MIETLKKIKSDKENELKEEEEELEHELFYKELEKLSLSCKIYIYSILI
jgi:hypothetical protein